jgi:hypothetical protein
MKVTCPNCNTNHKVRVIDNEPLCMQHETTVKEYYEMDDELYVFFLCDDCNQQFRKTFDIVEKPKVPTVIVEPKVSCPNCGCKADIPTLPLNSTGEYAEIICEECANIYYTKGLK